MSSYFNIETFFNFDLYDYVKSENQECKICHENFTKKDLLEKKVHKTCCNHFFHKKCIDNDYKKRPLQHYLCEVCKSPMNYDNDLTRWKKTMETIYDRVPEAFESSGGIKRRRENDSITEGKISRPRFSDSLPFYQLNLDVLEKIFSKTFTPHYPTKDLNQPEKFLDFLKVALEAHSKVRLISKIFAECFSLEKFFSTLKMHLEEKELRVHEILNDSGHNPLMIASRDNLGLIRTLLEIANNPKALVTNRDNSGMNAFNDEIQDHKNAKSLRLMLEKAQLSELEIIEAFEYEGDFTDSRLISYIDNNAESFACMQVLMEKAGNRQFDLIKFALDDSLFEGKREMVLFYLNLLSKVSDKSGLAKFCVEYEWDCLINNGNILDKDLNNWFKEFLPREFLPYWLALAGERAFDCLFQEGKQYTLLHFAVLSNSLEVVKAMTQYAKPRELELLKARTTRFAIDMDDGDDGEADASDQTALELALQLNNTSIATYLNERMLLLATEQNDQETLDQLRQIQNHQ